ncbi:RluA family pseudouridine synthase [Polaromonas sp. CG_23.6]|uniref:RluA family pseudouridine synthase n=1 Tax=unclassified Polaromonas TaxID=2638319 RepID=UPI0018C9D206|nr:RluA family pseudouridine synthase [Polaromonas sp. CG_23.6]MBG6071124.1 tRNA pseudouridine32 synthase/23S rRNA pseudouridine746 synthase [Polaromonas sp. CG_9.7]MBG6113124.1 tRNA pseudouridine32 synthase/23S rRNA pseudouridine746 synthase [Polaromonas sp. CG_9.2]MDH6185655.1 tRNA pseudouridine32 synthase/23S rRNA pseudouridine746 synthase [Polaromonas sp. CG_23.6]
MNPPLAHGGLPTRHGVGPSCVSLPAGSWPTFTDFLAERFPAIMRATWLERMAAGLVADEFGAQVTAQRPYQGHMRLYYYRDLPFEARIPFEAAVLFQDEHLVVADKPHFLPVTPSGHYLQETLLVRLKNQLGIDSLIPIHRIDRETAGLVLFSVRPEERNAYQALFRQHEIVKHYEAVAPWRPELQFPLLRKTRIVEDEPFFRQREVPGEANSETLIDVLQIRGEQALYALSPVTGKKHQLRVHMNALGLPIRNDRMYPPVDVTPDDDYTQPLQLLARSIAFTDPLTGKPRRFESRLGLSLE